MKTYIKNFKNVDELNQWLNNKDMNIREVSCTPIENGYTVEYIKL